MVDTTTHESKRDCAHGNDTKEAEDPTRTIVQRVGSQTEED